MPSGSRIIVLICLAIVAPFLIVGCGDGEPPSPTPPSPVRLAADPALAERAFAAAEELLSAAGLDVVLMGDAVAADLVVGFPPYGANAATETASAGVSFVTRYWAPVAALSTPLADVSLADLDGALVPIDPAPPLDEWGLAVRPMAIGEIPAALAADSSLVALLPLDAIDARVRTLAVDGANVVFGTGDLNAYPLVERAWVRRLDVGDEALAATLDGVARDLAARLSLPPPEPIILRATGDIIPARCVYAKHVDYGDFRHAFLVLGPWLAEADITVGSLDASISDAGAPIGCEPTFNLLAPPESVEGLVYGGFDVITVATNHVLNCGRSDCGSEALLDTLDILRSNGIAPVGGGADLAEARMPAIVTVNGVSFAFLGYDEIAPPYHATETRPGTAPLTEVVLREDIAAARARADVVVVLPQWGVEYTANPTIGQRRLAAAAADAGAALVIGNHPHWVQAAEVIGETFVAYALGNFVFDQDWSLETQQGVVLEAAFHGARLVGVQYVPIHIIDQHQPVVAEPAEAAQIMERIWRASAVLE